MSTSWEDDVAVAVGEAVAGRGNADTARVLAAEVHRLQGLHLDDLVEKLKRCPRCGLVADSVETRLGKPTIFRHGQREHLDLSVEMKAVRNGG